MTSNDQLWDALAGELEASDPAIVDIDGERAYINVGLTEGIRNGDKFGVWDRGRELSDPATGAVTFGPLLCRIYPLKKYT